MPLSFTFPLATEVARPEKDGLSVLKEIMKTNPDSKVILITASEDQKVIGECLELGAKSYISKPFDFNNVLKVISEYI